MAETDFGQVWCVTRGEPAGALIAHLTSTIKGAVTSFTPDMHKYTHLSWSEWTILLERFGIVSIQQPYRRLNYCRHCLCTPTHSFQAAVYCPPHAAAAYARVGLYCSVSKPLLLPNTQNLPKEALDLELYMAETVEYT